MNASQGNSYSAFGTYQFDFWYPQHPIYYDKCLGPDVCILLSATYSISDTDAAFRANNERRYEIWEGKVKDAELTGDWCECTVYKKLMFDNFFSFFFLNVQFKTWFD